MTFRERIGRVRSRLTLPLFVKELTEASSRRRTYVVRTVYAGLLFLLAVMMSRDVLFPAGDAFAILGSGGKLFLTVMLIQFGGVYLFLPAMTAGAITAEKERNTLGLLLLTKLSPTKIVIEKFFGRVFPMLCLALLSLPLLAVAYSLGGLDVAMLLDGVVRLMATILMIGAIGIACSAWCRTTAGAYLMTLAVLGLLFPLPVIVAIAGGLSPGDDLIQDLGQLGVDLQLWSRPEGMLFAFFGPYTLLEWRDAMEYSNRIGVTAFFQRSASLVVWQTSPILLVALASLGAARFALVRRAEVKPKRYLIRLFRAVDARLRTLNDRYAKGIEVVKTSGQLPDDDPIAWRETTKTSLGSFRYLVRLLLLVETPVLFFGLIATDGYSQSGNDALTFLVVILWIGSMLLVTVKAAGLLPGERARQSLDVLLTTPLATREILRQKLAGVWRLIVVCAIPLMSAYGLVAFMRYGTVYIDFGTAALCLVAATSVTVFHLMLAAYLSAYVGMRLSTQSRAMLTSVGVLVALSLAIPLWWLVFDVRSERFPNGTMFSPFLVMLVLANDRLDASELLLIIVANTFLYGGAALVLRYVCQVSAPKWLGRTENRRHVEFRRWQVPTAVDEPQAATEVSG